MNKECARVNTLFDELAPENNGDSVSDIEVRLKREATSPKT